MFNPTVASVSYYLQDLFSISLNINDTAAACKQQVTNTKISRPELHDRHSTEHEPTELQGIPLITHGFHYSQYTHTHSCSDCSRLLILGQRVVCWLAS